MTDLDPSPRVSSAGSADGPKANEPGEMPALFSSTSRIRSLWGCLFGVLSVNMLLMYLFILLAAVGHSADHGVNGLSLFFLTFGGLGSLASAYAVFGVIRYWARGEYWFLRLTDAYMEWGSCSRSSREDRSVIQRIEITNKVRTKIRVVRADGQAVTVNPEAPFLAGSEHLAACLCSYWPEVVVLMNGMELQAAYAPTATRGRA